MSIALAILVLLAIAFMLPWKVNFLRATIAERVEAATGRAFVIEGDLWWWWKGRFTAEGLRFANPAWAGREQMITVGKVDARIAMGPLLRERRVVLPRVEVVQPDLWLETSADGKFNGRLDREQKDDGSGVQLGEVVLDRGLLHFVRKHTRTALELQIETTRAGDRQGIAVVAGGAWNGLKVEAKGTGDAVLRLREAAEPYHLDIGGSIGETNVKLAGSITGLAKPTAADLKVAVDGPSLGAWYRIVNVGLPASPPYRTAGRVRLDGGVWTYEDFTSRVGNSDLAGRVRYEPRPARPFISGTLVSQRLDLKDFSPAVGKAPAKADEKPVPGQGKAPPKATAAPSATLLPQWSFSAEKWDTLDADIRFEGKTIVNVGKAPFDDLKMHVKLDDKRLTLDPLRLGFAGGSLAGSLSVNGRENPMAARIDVAARRLKLEELLPMVNNERLGLGLVNAKVALSGRGNSIGRMLATADGEAQAAMGKGQMSNLFIELIDLDAQEALGFLIRGDRPVPVRCALVDVNFKDGVLNTRNVVFDTNDTIIETTGKASFADEQLDLRVKPIAKDMSLLTLRVPFDVKGPFKQPSISPDKGRLALRAGGALLLGTIAPLAALIPLIETGPGRDADCDALMARAKSEGVPVRDKTAPADLPPPAAGPQKRK